MQLSEYSVKRCHTAAGWLLHNNRVLLVKHKLLGIWLAPGGHIEENELPHHAAEREFFEETGIKVRAISAYVGPKSAKETEHLPLPFVYNLHWINRPGELKRNPTSGKICEQHYVFGFFVKPAGSLSLGRGDEGIEDIRWYSLSEINDLQTSDTIKNEARFVFQHYPVRI